MAFSLVRMCALVHGASSYENSQSRGLFQLGRGYFHPFVATARHEQLS